MPKQIRGASTQQTKQSASAAKPSLAPSAQPEAVVQRALQLPGTISAADVLTLQRTVGNRSTLRLLAGGRGSVRPNSTQQPPIQAKLRVGPVGDAYEQEADRVATEVVGASSPPPAAEATPPPKDLYQSPQLRDRLQAKSLATRITPLTQRAPTRNGDNGAGFDAGPEVEAQLNSEKGRGQPLPAYTRARMEARFGTDFSPVRIHAGAQAGQLSRKINAQAFTRGTDIYFGAGKYNPGSSGGQHLLAHELTHVVQQTGPAVRRQPNKDAAKFNSKPKSITPAQRTSVKSVQRKLLINGEEKNISATGDERLNKGQKMMLEGMVENELRIYKFTTVENLVAYLKDVRREDLVEIEELQPVEKPTAKKETRWGRAILGGLGGLILAPLGAAIGAIGGAVRGAMGGAKSVYNKLAGGSQSGTVKFLAGLAAAGGGLLGLVRGAITGALGGFAAAPAAGALAAAPELADEESDSTKNETKIAMNDLQAGDIVMVRGGGGVGGGMISFGQYLHQLWSGDSREASAGFRHAGVYIGGQKYAHASGGIFEDDITPGLFVYRSTSPKLAQQATKIAKKWATFRNDANTVAEIGYSAGKAGDAIFRSSSFNSSRAAVLAAYFAQGIKPGAMFCSEFAISVYQAAALQPAMDELRRERPRTEDKGETKSWAKRNKDRIMQGANRAATTRGQAGQPTGGLNVDPRRTAPQMLAAELQRGTKGDSPTWQYKGVIE